MATIKEDYVSFDLAKLLKEKGFDETCRSYFIDHVDYIDSSYSIEGLTDLNMGVWETLRPTHQMVMKWLREVHKIYLNINVRVILGQWAGYDISVYTTDNYGFLNKNIPIKLKDNLSYEKAVEAAIKYVLENLI